VIPIQKPKPAPSRLITQGKSKTSSHIRDHNQNPSAYQLGEKIFKFSSNIYGASSVKTALILAQHKKCCFCERLVGEDGDVEHFRPKSAYCQQKGETLTRPGYYWLAYDWDNLYLSCSACNQRCKRNLFPLVNPTNRAHLHNNDISLEEPLLVDPGKEEPSQHILFRGADPLPVAGSIKGRTTIDLVGLDRSILNHARLEHLKKMKGLYKFITDAATKPQSQALQNLVAEAKDVLQSAISDKGEFAAATRAALQDQFKFVM
jgi:uncharacterized protein (TIGR02646 family)